MKGRHAGQAPDIDGQVFLSGAEVQPGDFRRVLISQASDYDLVGEVVEEPSLAGPAGGPLATAKKRRVGLRVVA